MDGGGAAATQPPLPGFGEGGGEGYKCGLLGSDVAGQWTPHMDAMMKHHFQNSGGGWRAAALNDLPSENSQTVTARW